MSSIEITKELEKTMIQIKKELKNLNNSIKNTIKLEDLEYVENNFDDLQTQILILDEEIEGFKEIEKEEFQALQIYQEPISGETYGIGPWQ